MIQTVLVANRGEIACRVIATLRRMGLRSVAVYSDADRHAPHVRDADLAVRLGPGPASQSYLAAERIVDACVDHGVDAVHPGYGFLSENAAFVEALSAAGVTFIGPHAEHIRLFGEKHTARAAAEHAGVPLLAGTGLVASPAEAAKAAAAIGFPLMLKSTAGGGGIGLRLCRTADELPKRFEEVSRAAAASFGDGRLFLERYVVKARHVEVQIFGDGRDIVALGERDCSLQRRNQKVVEETPAPNLPPAVRETLIEAAVRLGRSVDYVSAGTVEFIYDLERGEVAFLEVNTRLQVEHPVTEAVTGIDLVEWMVRAARGTLDLSAERIEPRGHAIEARIYAEDPSRDFRPSSGTLSAVRLARGARVDGWIEPGLTVPPHYDALLAKVIVRRDTREAAAQGLTAALAETEIHGVTTNLDYLVAVTAAPAFRDGTMTTRTLETFVHSARTVEVLAPGMQTTVQDWPGRIGAWSVGVPPSGPMDALSHRLANRVVGNGDDAATLEITLQGPTLRFHGPTLVALTGADCNAKLDGVALELYRPIDVAAGATLTIGTAQVGLRAYLAVRGGWDGAQVLGSRSTFTLGGFGGHATGAVAAGDTLRFAQGAAPYEPLAAPAAAPTIRHEWTLGVLYGPHGAPDFFTEEDIAVLLATPYTVGVQSARTGVRLEGPRPQFARADGGEAGLHPSNIHDNAYAVGAVDFTGDVPIILGPDGPSLGGFVCPFVVVRAELWKLGQLRPGDSVRFAALTAEEAADRLKAQEAALADLGPPPEAPAIRTGPPESAVRLSRPDRPISVTYRRAGDDYLLVEFGDNVLDLDLRVRAHALMERVEAEPIDGLIEMTPGIRSLQFHYDGAAIAEGRLIDTLDEMESELPAPRNTVVPSRTVHLPLAWDDRETRLATERYQANVRTDAPWCPWNLEFIRRINGLASVDDVRDIVFDAHYLVYGLGDVYLGAPVATPLDPRHRLVTTKYNPARTWTPQNAVGIGGAYLCIYGMEGPGGYQFVGRTLQVWNTFRRTAAFGDVPWLLRYFDRIRFYPVDEPTLLDMREGFPFGEVEIRIDDGTLSVADEHAQLAGASAEIAAFRARREAAFAQERERWEAQGLTLPAAPAPADLDLPTRSVTTREVPTVDATLSGVVWSILVAPGQRIEAGQRVALLEAMKLEVAVDALVAGVVGEVLVAPQQTVRAGEPLMTIVPQA